jgi:hypothetical protein
MCSSKAHFTNRVVVQPNKTVSVSDMTSVVGMRGLNVYQDRLRPRQVDNLQVATNTRNQKTCAITEVVRHGTEPSCPLGSAGALKLASGD